jgi:hypothetical protein
MALSTSISDSGNLHAAGAARILQKCGIGLSSWAGKERSLTSGRAIALGVEWAVSIAIYAMYARTLSIALKRRIPRARTRTLVLVWFVAIPILQVVAHSIIVAELNGAQGQRSTTMGSDSHSMTLSPWIGHLATLNMVASYLFLLLNRYLPVSGWSLPLTLVVGLPTIALFICWIVYWRQVARISAFWAAQHAL